MFAFCNRERDKIKILEWDHNGFRLYYHRLERGRFSWPADPGAGAIAVTRRELRWLLDGPSLTQKNAHRTHGSGQVLHSPRSRESGMPKWILYPVLQIEPIAQRTEHGES